MGSSLAATFTAIRQHTPSGDVEAAVRIADGCDAIVAFGGGSVIDAAKAVAEEIGRPPQVAIPTSVARRRDWRRALSRTTVPVTVTPSAA